MTGVWEYFSSIVAAALIGVVVSYLVKDPRLQGLMKIVTGMLMLLVLLRPLVNLDPEALGKEMQEAYGSQFSRSDYEDLYYQQLYQQIKTTTERYVLEKAGSLGATVEVEVELSRDSYPIPSGITIIGILTESQKQSLQTYFTTELGIPLEKQRWNEHG